ncbi:MAG: hypothetical protein EVA59_13310 [Limnobacter sp.]|uniref:hypothetical protein n=1 Tax=Limnobacter sp. TaxID=2003368 RepID=UPI00120EF439|nr:hypothetical protein [Limnobacter sp.]RZO91451.1 MAG: hypothetical protein EVA59_13310 [Limnobacter sp.]
MENNNHKKNENQINFLPLIATIFLIGLTVCLAFYITPEYGFITFELALIIASFIFLRFRSSGMRIDGALLSLVLVIVSIWVGAMSSSLDNNQSITSYLGNLACQSGATSYCKKERGSCKHGCSPSPEVAKPQ